MPPSDVNYLLKGSCILCHVERNIINRKVEPLSGCLTKDGCDSIFAAAQRCSNEWVKAIVHSGVDVIAKEAQYHKSYRREFYKEVEGDVPKNEDVSSRRPHSNTFGTKSALIEMDIIGNRKAMLSNSILDIFYRCRWDNRRY